jgi:hypothetical protein
LISRAKRLTFGLYDTLKDGAPFLRQHREDIAAAQHTTADVAAEPAQPVKEPELVHHIEPDTTTPRRGEYEGERITIGQRKIARR